ARLAALERLSVHRPGEVDHHEVAALRGAVDVLERRGGLAQALELGVDGLGRHLRLAAAHLEPLVLAELRLRADADLDRELERRPGVGQLGEVEARIADGHDPRVRDGLLVPAGQGARARVDTGAALPPASPPRRLLAWIYTGPPGHLWSTTADVVSLWARWGLAAARRRARSTRIGRSRRAG